MILVATRDARPCHERHQAVAARPGHVPRAPYFGTMTDTAPPRPWSRREDGIVTVAFWLGFGTLQAVREASRTWGVEPIAWGGVAETFAEVGLWALLTPAVFWIARRYPAERGAWAGRAAAQLALGAVVAVAIEALTRGVIDPVLTGHAPPDRAWTFAGALGRLRFLDELIIYLAVLATGYARAALFEVHERGIEAERHLAERAQLEAQLAQARLSALQMQLQPHFLFNALNAVSALVERDPAGVRTLVARLSSLLRRVLDAPAELVPLREEAAFLRDYLDVQRVRFQGRLEVEEDWAPGALDALVPPLVLQPLVENAVGHGVSRIEDGVGVVRLAARRDGGRLVLTVEDNGPGLAAPPGGDGRAAGGAGVGLANTRARLDALYGDAGALALAPAPGGGAVATVTLPFRPALSGDGAAAPVALPAGRG